MRMAIPLKTARLELRSIRESDLSAFTQIVGNPRVAMPAGFQPVHNEFEARFLMRQTLGQRWIWGVTRQEEGQIIGTVGLYGRTGHDGALVHGERDIGYMLNENFWGHGYMPEAVMAVLTYGFDQGLQAVWGSYFSDNERSARIFERFGFQFDHEIQHSATDFFAPGKTERFFRLTPNDFALNQ
ncbi:GNAT family N-acetyltransferase [Lactobacillus rossiae]|uniref:GNAT family N-acetyltransferase n=2 Tax=Furfurilactobacillus milii TaxID=2888272 RepID=A0A6N9I0C9_9LACO|nr:GNAT family N-acetyltransferase [Furfurilactobacillus milii]